MMRRSPFLLGLALAAAGACGSETSTNPAPPPPVTQPPPPPPPPTIQAPTQGPSALSFGSVTPTSIRVTWVNGNGVGRVVLWREGAAVDAAPEDGKTYTANTQFGGGQELGDGNFVVFEGDATAIEVTALTPGASYHFTVFEYNGSGADRRYQRSDRAQGDRPTDQRGASLIGSWLWGSAGAKLSAVFTAMDDTTYMIVDDGSADGGGGPGAEWGHYQWSPTGGRLTAQPITDTSGDWGLSGFVAATVTISGDELTLRDPPDIEIAMRVLPSSTNPLVGTWVQRDPADPGYLLVVTFLDDQHWMLGVDDALTSTGGPGMEQGTYTWNQGTGSFTATGTSDTSGDTGLRPLRASGTAVVRANLLTYTVPGLAPVTLVRVQ